MTHLHPVRKVIIAGNRHQDRFLSEIGQLLVLLFNKGITVCMERRFADYLIGQNVALDNVDIVDNPPVDAGAAISVGGDGTFLRTARWIGPLQIPVLGINTGHLGFLAAYTPAESADLVDMLYHGHAWIEDRTALKIDVGDCPNAPILPFALNEVAILKDDSSAMINVNVDIDGNYLADYLADGLLISTPTGSTGYNLSVGGPIIFPSLDVISLSPIAPHSLTLRPCVVNGDAVITARTTTREAHYRISLDGVSFRMLPNTEVKISRADFSPKVIRRRDDSFASTLRNKLLWGLR